MPSAPIGSVCRVEDGAQDCGSAVLEGIAAVAVVFLLFTVLVQAATALVAHQAAEAAVAGAARRTALGSGVEIDEQRLLETLEATVPGGHNIEAGVASDGRVARAWARFDFQPPGPILRSFRFAVEAEVPVVVVP